MGITGLLPFLDKSSKRVNIKEYAGQTVAIDAYCWLHKGAFSCAEKLVMKEPTNTYVMYCMKFVNMLLSHNIKPILVFDGRYLPAKSHTEKKRRENREINRKKGAELLRAGRVDEGRSYLRRSVDITHELALNLIKECRRRNIDCIVAPYEADAQLAYLNIKNIAQVVITEDSDLLLFGCTRVMFKMDVNGNGILIEKDRLHISMGIRSDNFSLDKFRYMCILSGCDYLPSLPGIGLTKACRFVNRTSETNIYEALRKLPVNLNMWTLVVPDEYRQSFVEADRTFRFQLVYDPVQRRQVPLTEVENESEVVGSLLDNDTAYQLALGNYDPMTLRKMDDYNPDKISPKTNRLDLAIVTSHPSIWSKDFAPTTPKPKNSESLTRLSTFGICVTTAPPLPKKRSNESDSSKAPEISREQLLDFYGGELKRPNGGCHEANFTESREDAPLVSSPSERQTSPVLLTSRRNVFAVQKKVTSSYKRNSGGALSKFVKVQPEESVSSRYFTSPESADISESLYLSSDKESCFSISKSENEDMLDTSVSSLPTEPSPCRSLKRDESLHKINRSLMLTQDSGRGLSISKHFSLKEFVFEKETIAKKKLFDVSLEKDVDILKSSQEENCLNVMNANFSEDVKVRISSDENKPLIPTADAACKIKEFYSGKPEYENVFKGNANDEALSQLNSSDSSGPSRNLFSVSPLLSCTNMSQKKPKSTKKSVSRVGLSRPNQGKQSNLAQFGFQPRPKILSDSKRCS